MPLSRTLPSLVSGGIHQEAGNTEGRILKCTRDHSRLYTPCGTPSSGCHFAETEAHGDDQAE